MCSVSDEKRFAWCAICAENVRAYLCSLQMCRKCAHILWRCNSLQLRRPATRRVVQCQCQGRERVRHSCKTNTLHWCRLPYVWNYSYTWPVCNLIGKGLRRANGWQTQNTYFDLNPSTFWGIIWVVAKKSCHPYFNTTNSNWKFLSPGKSNQANLTVRFLRHKIEKEVRAFKAKAVLWRIYLYTCDKSPERCRKYNSL